MMPRDEKDWNWDRMHSAQALMADCQRDMMNCLHRGAVVDVVQERMLQRLKSAHEQISKLKLFHEE